MNVTSKFKGLIMSVVILVIALLLMPLVISSVMDAQTDTRTQSFAGAVVGGTTTDVVLTAGYGLWEDSNTSVTAITATGAGAVPVAGTYVAATRTLTVTGLGADTPQDISVTYRYDANSAYNGVNSIVGLIPLLVVVGLIIVAIINGIWALKKD